MNSEQLTLEIGLCTLRQWCSTLGCILYLPGKALKNANPWIPPQNLGNFLKSSMVDSDEQAGVETYCADPRLFEVHLLIGNEWKSARVSCGILDSV